MNERFDQKNYSVDQLVYQEGNFTRVRLDYVTILNRIWKLNFKF